MPAKKEQKQIVTKTGVSVETNYCRKCMKTLPAKDFYESVDAGFIDSNGIMSVCKECIQTLYNNVYEETQSIEKTIHKLCTSLNIRYSNEAVSATKAHITTLLESGKNVSAIFSIYKMKIVATKKSMDKSIVEDMSYEDVGTIYTSDSKIDTKETIIPKEVIDFWGDDLDKKEIEFLEKQYANFKNTHKADTYAEIVLLKQVCYTMLDIKKLRANNDSTEKLVKELQALMKDLAISPNAVNSSSTSNKGEDSFGLWIQDIEKYEPAQWLKSDPRGEIYRDVSNTEEYFQKYVVRPLKNFILGSKDFNISDDDEDSSSVEDDDIISFDDVENEDSSQIDEEKDEQKD